MDLILFSILFVAKPCVCSLRSYDVSEEAQKLHHRSTKELLSEFRRTQDYLTILDGRRQSLMQQMESAIHYQLVDLVISLPEKINVSLPSPQAHARRAWDPLGGVWRRQEAEEEKPDLKSIQTLETLPQFHRKQAEVDRLNKAKDLAFEETGVIIHLAISAMGDATETGTKQPWGGSEPEHSTHLDHKVTADSHASSTVAAGRTYAG